MSEKILIFDTTLRDAEQTPGAALNGNEKLAIAKHLSALNVDVLLSCRAGVSVRIHGSSDHA